MSLNPNAPRFYSVTPSVSPSVSPTPMKKEKDSILKHVKQEYEFPYTLRQEYPQQKPFEMAVIHNTHFRPVRS